MVAPTGFVLCFSFSFAIFCFPFSFVNFYFSFSLKCGSLWAATPTIFAFVFLRADRIVRPYSFFVFYSMSFIAVLFKKFLNNNSIHFSMYSYSSFRIIYVNIILYLFVLVNISFVFYKRGL